MLHHHYRYHHQSLPQLLFLYLIFKLVATKCNLVDILEECVEHFKQNIEWLYGIYIMRQKKIDISAKTMRLILWVYKCVRIVFVASRKGLQQECSRSIASLLQRFVWPASEYIFVHVPLWHYSYLQNNNMKSIRLIAIFQIEFCVLWPYLFHTHIHTYVYMYMNKPQKCCFVSLNFIESYFQFISREFCMLV